jgi:hypothetical protein
MLLKASNTLKPKDKITVEAQIKNTKGTYTYYQTTVSIFKKDGAELRASFVYCTGYVGKSEV